MEYGKYGIGIKTLHWLEKESVSEQPPSDHVDKLASKQSVDQNKEHNSYFPKKMQRNS